jgi:peptidoglycan/xylan/chitin deacetylase (PgdA/CDA1 family)
MFLRPLIARVREEKRWQETARNVRQMQAEEERKEQEYDARYALATSDRSFGIALSFDDKDDIADWHRFFTQDQVKQLGAKVTFFVNNPDQLTPKEIDQLKDLQAVGHEIGCHGFRHVDALKCVERYGINGYIEREVKPAIEATAAQGFHPKTFAYGGGYRTPATDNALLDHFVIVRGTMKGTDEEMKTRRGEWYTISPNERGRRMVWADSIDERLLAPFGLPPTAGIALAKKRGRIYVAYAHDIAFDEREFNEANPRRVVTIWHECLLDLLKYAHRQGARFYTMSELE